MAMLTKKTVRQLALKPGMISYIYSPSPTCFHTIKTIVPITIPARADCQLVFREKSANNIKGPKACSYQFIRISNPKMAKRIFSHLLGVDAVVRKTRRIYLKRNIRIHLDSVSKLGKFIEFEAVLKRPSAEAKKRARQEVALLMKKFGIKPRQLMRQSYRELINRSS